MKIPLNIKNKLNRHSWPMAFYNFCQGLKPEQKYPNINRVLKIKKQPSVFGYESPSQKLEVQHEQPVNCSLKTINASASSDPMA